MVAVDNLRIDSDRLWSSLMEMAAIGATPNGGVCRLALTDLDRQGRDLFVRWCREAGPSLRVDAIGNIFARRAGRDDSLPAVLTGSHLDSQPTGGKFDGAYGVLAGLEVVRSLNDLGRATEAPVEVVAWTNEEGARFAPAMMGSGVYAGVLDLAATRARRDLNGKSVAEELARIGYAGDAALGEPRPGAYFEAHIEQGPILEREGKPIGVVTGAQGIRWYDIHVTGQDFHASTTPMTARKDALVGAARIVDGLNALGLANLPDARLTVGQLVVKPNSRNVIPGAVTLSLDLRHPDSATLDRLEREMKETAVRIGGALDLETRIETVEKAAPVTFDAGCVAAVRDAARAAGLDHRDMASGAGHDACHVAKVAPAAMIFVPCKKGLSHNELESAAAADLARGCEVLLRAILAKANPLSTPGGGEGRGEAGESVAHPPHPVPLRKAERGPTEPSR